MVVKVVKNKYEKLLWFCFSVLCVLHSKHSSVWYKNWKTQKIAGNLSPKKIVEIFAKPRKIAKKNCLPRKIGFGQISNPKKSRTSIPVKLLTCAPLPGLLEDIHSSTRGFCAILSRDLVAQERSLSFNYGRPMESWSSLEQMYFVKRRASHMNLFWSGWILLMILSEAVIVETEPYSKIGRTHCL